MPIDPRVLPRVLTTEGAQRLGLTRSRVRTELANKRWLRLAPGIWLTRPDPPQRLDWAVAGLAMGGRDAALTGWDAVRMRGLGPTRPPTTLVSVLVPRGSNRRLGDLRLRPSKRFVTSTLVSDASRPEPLRVVSTARAVADTALDIGGAHVVRALVTQAIQRELCSYEELADELAAAPRNGSGHLRLALVDIGRGARSIAEAEAVALLQRPDVPPFEVNADVVDSSGRLVAVADVLWRELRAILEIDSREFHFAERDWKDTMRRHNRLASLGYAVVHYPPSAVRSGGQIWVDEVVAWLRSRGAELGRLAR